MNLNRCHKISDDFSKSILLPAFSHCKSSANSIIDSNYKNKVENGEIRFLCLFQKSEVKFWPKYFKSKIYNQNYI